MKTKKRQRAAVTKGRRAQAEHAGLKALMGAEEHSRLLAVLAENDGADVEVSLYVRDGAGGRARKILRLLRACGVSGRVKAAERLDRNEIVVHLKKQLVFIIIKLNGESERRDAARRRGVEESDVSCAAL